MKTLLVYALKAEAHILKQHFPSASRTLALHGTELLNLNEEYDLLKTGMGLSQAQSALKRLPTPHSYERCIHFGVSGSLSDSVDVQALVMSHIFTAHDQTPIVFVPHAQRTWENVQTVTFFSSSIAITDESSRKRANLEGASAVDMESYSVAAYCQAKQLPLLALRCISDRAGNSTEVDFRQNFEQASEKLQHFLLKHILTAKRSYS